jgi:hypothetical protein
VNTIRRQSTELRFVKPLVDVSPIADRYYQSSLEERNSPRMKELARVYQGFTGEIIGNLD